MFTKSWYLLNGALLNRGLGVFVFVFIIIQKCGKLRSVSLNNFIKYKQTLKLLVVYVIVEVVINRNGQNFDFVYEIQFLGFGSKSFAQNCFELVSFGFWGVCPKTDRSICCHKLYMKIDTM